MAATLQASHSKRQVHTFISTSRTCVFPLNHNLQIYDYDYDHDVARFTRQSHIPNFCHIYPQYRFLIYMKYRIPCQDVSESRTLQEILAFSRIPRYIPEIPYQTLCEAGESHLKRPKGTWFLSVGFSYGRQIVLSYNRALTNSHR